MENFEVEERADGDELLHGGDMLHGYVGGVGHHADDLFGFSDDFHARLEAIAAGCWDVGFRDITEVRDCLFELCWLDDLDSGGCHDNRS